MKLLAEIFSKMLPFLRELLKAAQPYLIKYLQTEAVKRAIKLFFKTATPGGIKLWLIEYAIKQLLFDKAITPAIQGIFRKLGYTFDVGEGQILIKRRKRAIDENNQTDYDNTIDDILS